MKTKYLVIIFILFLLIALASGLVVFLTEEKGEPVLSEQISVVEKQVKPAPKESARSALNEPAKVVPAIPKEAVNASAEEKIKATIIIGGAKYEAEIKAGSSVYDLMNLLKIKNKIKFSGKNYQELGFFVEEINGLKNNPAGENWLYYVNGQPVQVGVSNYKIKNGDTIEWKYEAKSF
jgi:hypothetical protein